MSDQPSLTGMRQECLRWMVLPLAIMVVVRAKQQCSRDACDEHLRYENLHYEVLSERPRIYYYPDFLSDEECNTIRDLGVPFVKLLVATLHPDQIGMSQDECPDF
jgi:hypothetical protein